MAAIAATATAMAVLKPKLSVAPPTASLNAPRATAKPAAISFRSLENQAPKNVAAATAVAGAVFASLATSDAALAAQQLAEIADGDSRGLALLLPIAPAVLWVLYNILQPALNQLNRMRAERAVVGALGLGAALAASGVVSPAESAAAEVASVAAAAEGSDSRGLLLLLVVAPAIGWVLYNILQPALNQLNRMRSE